MKLEVQMDPGSSTHGTVTSTHDVQVASGSRFRFQHLITASRSQQEREDLYEDETGLVYLIIRHEDSRTPLPSVQPGGVFRYGLEMPENSPFSPYKGAGIYFDVYREGNLISLMKTNLSGVSYVGRGVRIEPVHYNDKPAYELFCAGTEQVCRRVERQGPFERYVVYGFGE